MNLAVVTPPWLQFRILTKGPIEMREGAVIDYTIRLHGIPLTWRSEIAVWEPPFRFMDVQTRGPYRIWRHEHTFREMNGGTVVTDDVKYLAPGGTLVDRWVVRPDLDRIFAYRRRKMQELLWKRQR
jgi:ligand-binding SRPBCC domain-containing protein